MAKKLVDLDNITRLASALDSRMKNKIVLEELRARGEESNLLQAINEVKAMLGGKSLVYITQAEYDALSEEARNDEDIMYFITDAEDISHTHDNLEFLNSLNEEYFADLDSEITDLKNNKVNKSEYESKIGELTTNITNEIDRATEKEEEIIAEVDRVEDMLGGKSLVYITQAEYDGLSEEERNNENKMYFITDAEDISHTHDNMDVLNQISNETFAKINADITTLKNDKMNSADADAKYVTAHVSEEEAATGVAISALSLNGVEIKPIVTADTVYYGNLTLDSCLDNIDTIISVLSSSIGDGNKLLTDAKATVVDAINELQTEINNLDANKADQSYVDEKLEVVDAIKLNGYSIWVGTTEELNNIAQRDPKTLYFEISEEDFEEEDSIEVVQVNPVNGVLTLTTNKYQKTTITNGTEIVFPEVNKFTEIHLYFDAETDMDLNFPDCRWRVDPNIEAGKSYEIVATYNTIQWLVNVIVYS